MFVDIKSPDIRLSVCQVTGVLSHHIIVNTLAVGVIMIFIVQPFIHMCQNIFQVLDTVLPGFYRIITQVLCHG